MIRAEVVEKLHAAIEKAEGRGDCRYVSWDNDGRPQPYCVVAQFAALCGVTAAELSDWRGVMVGAVLDGDPDEFPGREKLPEDPATRGVMVGLQLMWDERDPQSRDASLSQLKEAMHNLVDRLTK